MIFVPELLLVSGTSHKTGKTDFICKLIRKFSIDHTLIALKISDEEHMIKRDEKVVLHEKRFSIYKNIPDMEIDTSLMMRAGAAESYYIQADAKALKNAFIQFRKMLPEASLLVCESLSLYGVIMPGVFIYILDDPAMSDPHSEKADIILLNSEGGFNNVLQHIRVRRNKWKCVS